MANDRLSPPAGPSRRAARSSRPSAWNWLLAIPIVLSLLTPFYNRANPKLFGFPAFYWLQLSFVIVGVVSTTIVYQMTKNRRDGE